MAQKRFIRLRVEYSLGTSDGQATKLGDQLAEFAGTFGDVYIEDEGVAESTDDATRS